MPYQYWTRIRNPLNAERQGSLFKAAKDVYIALFPYDEREPWENFVSHILDSEQRACQGNLLEPEYFFYVATLRNNVCGMMSFRIHPRERLGFIAYMGVMRNNAVNSIMREAFNIISSEGNHVGVEGFLFEIETVPPEYLKLRTKKKRLLTDVEQNFYRRIKITDLFQRCGGARKLAWVRYQQPRLEWDQPEQQQRMHLMFAPLGAEREEYAYKSRADIKRYVKYVYLVAYLDAYKCAEKCSSASDKKLKRWRIYLEKLYQEATQNLPKRILLQQINLSTSRKPIFISYPHVRPYLSFAEVTREYLEALGFPVFYWAKNRWQLVGDWSDAKIADKMNESTYFVLFLGKPSLRHEGQLYELNHLRENDFVSDSSRMVFALINRRSARPSLFEKWIPEKLIHGKFSQQDVHGAIESIASKIMVREGNK